MWLAQQIVARHCEPPSPKASAEPASTSTVAPPPASKPGAVLAERHAPRFSGSTYSSGRLASSPPLSGSILAGNRSKAYLRSVAGVSE
jgi:hypothetical protein